jgi:hypothetical protein
MFKTLVDSEVYISILMALREKLIHRHSTAGDPAMATPMSRNNASPTEDSRQQKPSDGFDPSKSTPPHSHEEIRQDVLDDEEALWSFVFEDDIDVD